MRVLLGTENYFTVLKPKQADDLAESLTDEEDESWTYKSVHDFPKPGQAVVMVFDEDNNLLGKL